MEPENLKSKTKKRPSNRSFFCLCDIYIKIKKMKNKKVIRLTESDLARLVKRVIEESNDNNDQNQKLNQLQNEIASYMEGEGFKLINDGEDKYIRSIIKKHTEKGEKFGTVRTIKWDSHTGLYVVFGEQNDMTDKRKNDVKSLVSRYGGKSEWDYDGSVLYCHIRL